MLQTAIFDQLLRREREHQLLNPTWDLFILIFLLSRLIYTASRGRRDRIIVILVSIYMSLAIVNYIPFVSSSGANISVNDAFALRVTVCFGYLHPLILFLYIQLVRTLGHGATQRQTLASHDFRSSRGTAC